MTRRDKDREEGTATVARPLVPDIPIFRTVDSAQRIRIVYAFWCCGILYEFDTREQAEKARDSLLARAREG